MKSTCTLRPAIPPLALTYFPQPLTPSTMPWSTPGTIELSTSATTATLMVLAVTPTSLAALDFDCARAGAPVSVPAASANTAMSPTVHDLDMNFPPRQRCEAGS